MRKHVSCLHLLNGDTFTVHSLCSFMMLLYHLTYCGLVTPYGDLEMGQHCLRKWLVAWRHQAITWTNVDLCLVRSKDISVRTILQNIPQLSIIKISLQITYMNFSFKYPRGQWFNLTLHYLNRKLSQESYFLLYQFYLLVLKYACEIFTLHSYLGIGQNHAFDFMKQIWMLYLKLAILSFKCKYNLNCDISN